MLYGYMQREEDDWDRTRHLMAYMAQFAGFGASTFVDPLQVIKLNKDKGFVKPKITTLEQALVLLKEFE